MRNPFQSLSPFDELFPGGTPFQVFDTLDPGWTDNGDGSYTMDGAQASPQLATKEAGLTEGYYRVQWSYSGRTAGNIDFRVGDLDFQFLDENAASNSFDEVVYADGTSSEYEARATAAWDGTISGISVTLDTTAPVWLSSNPADGATDVAVDGGNLILNFDKRMKAGAGNAYIYDSNDVLFTTIDVGDATINGTQVTFPFAGTLEYETLYYALADDGVLQDINGNDWGGISDPNALRVTTEQEDAVAPTLSSSSPTDDATDVAATTNPTVTFNENIQLGSGNVTLYDVTNTQNFEVFDVSTDTGGGAGTVSVSSATLTIEPTTDFGSETEYAIKIDATAIEDMSGNAFAGVNDNTTISFTTADAVAPTLSSSSPTDDASDVLVTTNPTLTFSENVAFGTGNITIRDVTNSTDFEVFNVTTDTGGGAGTVSISGATVTIEPTTDLDGGTEYAIQVDGTAIDDLAGNSFAGIADETTVSWMTESAAHPTDLFQASEIGFFWDTTSADDLYQGTGLTSPVTADGQSVRSIADSSGNGNSGSTASGEEPEWSETDKAVDLNGSTDKGVLSAYTHDGTTEMSFACALKTTDTDAMLIYNEADTSSWSGHIGYGGSTLLTNQSGSPSFYVDGAVFTGDSEDFEAAVADGNWHLVEIRGVMDAGEWNGSQVRVAGYGSGSSIAHLDGLLGSPYLTSNNTTATLDAVRQWYADQYGITLA